MKEERIKRKKILGKGFRSKERKTKVRNIKTGRRREEKGNKLEESEGRGMIWNQ